MDSKKTPDENHNGLVEPVENDQNSPPAQMRHHWGASHHTDRHGTQRMVHHDQSHGSGHQSPHDAERSTQDGERITQDGARITQDGAQESLPHVAIASHADAPRGADTPHRAASSKKMGSAPQDLRERETVPHSTHDRETPRGIETPRAVETPHKVASTKRANSAHRRSMSDTTSFKEMKKLDAENQLHSELSKLLHTITNEADQKYFETQFAGFRELFARFLQDVGPSVIWDKIEPPPPAMVLSYDSLKDVSSNDQIKQMLNKLVVVKLNGGLGTSMGCKGPKSVIGVRNDLTFLDLTVQQIEHLNSKYGANVPLVLMNSFNTDEDTQKIIRKYKGFNLDLRTFNQSRFPRINRETLTPVETNLAAMNMDAWYPPGHGDFYQAFHNSGLLQKLIDDGREYCFVSNIDNLGATVDVKILNLLLGSGTSKHEFVMEVTDKTKADVKGGTLIQYDNRLMLLEIAQVPDEHVDDFKSIKKFKIFNTNNLWIKLSSIKRIIEAGTMDMEIITNPKTLENGVNVLQLETAAGAAMKNFEGAIGVNVPRSRFLPVKKTSDLLLVMSNLYALSNGSLEMNPKRIFVSVPLVKLGDSHFAKVSEFLKRFGSIPDILELDHLTVSGDVTFGRHVTLKGTVIIIANHGDRIDIPTGSFLDNKIVSGNLRILDH